MPLAASRPRAESEDVAAGLDDAAAAEAESVVDVGSSGVDTEVGSEVVVMTTVTGVALSPALEGD